MQYLICLKGEDRGQEWELPMVNIEIGRSPNNHVVVHDPKASRVHCKLVMGESIIKLVDLKSRNGTKVEGKLITEQEIHYDQFFQVGDTIFIVSPKSLQGRVADALGLDEEALEQHHPDRRWDEILWDELTRTRNGDGLKGGSLGSFLTTLKDNQEEEETKKWTSAPIRPKLSVKDLPPRNRPRI